MNFILSIDPAHLSLRNAFRGTLAVILAFLVCSPLSPTLGFLGGILAMLSSILIADATRKGQQETFLLMVPVVLISIVPSILLSPFHNLQLAGFMVFTFFAIYVRKYGPRWLPLGIVSFMSYFMPLFFPIPIPLIPLVLVTVVISLGFAFLLRVYILPDRADKTLKLYLMAFNKEYYILADAIKRGEKPSFQTLNDLTITIENFCNTGDSHAVKTRAEALQMTLFERETELQFQGKKVSTPVVMDALTTKEVASEKNPEPTSPSIGFLSSSKLAIQATLAVGIASYLGVMISTQRWYWAPMAAFVILTGSSRGETLLRAVIRVGGTMIGIMLGMLITPFLGEFHTLEWALIIVCVFWGIFSMRFTFGFWSASIFTFMLTLLFSLMGQLSNGVLILRFEETLLGAVLGALVSAIVLPTSTKKVSRAAMTKVLQAQANVLALLPLDPQDKESKRKLVHAIRTMDREFAALRLITTPFIGRFTLLKRGDIPSMLHDVTALGHYVRHLATNPKAEQNREKLYVMIEDLLKAIEDLNTQNVSMLMRHTMA